jgi:ATP-dependent Lon protease
LREKVLAAHRAGLKTVILPARNLKDLVEVPKRVRNELKIIPVEHMDQVLEVAMKPAEEKKVRTPRSRRKEKAENLVEGSVPTLGSIPAKGEGSIPISTEQKSEAEK